MTRYPFPLLTSWRIRLSGAAILAYLFFGEAVSTSQAAGMALIFTAIIIASRKGRKTQGL